ncbi:tetratricopeptide repeat protein [Breznakiella homolactica]|uniref:Tetratricopeptide repeat protein n=1 Tax=Breznakiella homolactica TaxID=2798577 RepID=A0A7T7XJZ2_9SPIR|nr:hypothetical protein [Breznakiella homolactica]QQO07597.1 hypothetical protein JFL75_11635 [Breznakiella homolactica]
MPLMGTPGTMPGNSGPETDPPGRFTLACDLFRAGLLDEAYRIFSSLMNAAPPPALLANLALCHMEAGLWDGAVPLLENALAGVKRIPGGAALPGDSVAAALAKKSGNSLGYRLPLAENAGTLAPDCTRDILQRLLIDCCAELEDWERVRAIGSALSGKNYANVEAALAKAGNR